MLKLICKSHLLKKNTESNSQSVSSLRTLHAKESYEDITS